MKAQNKSLRISITNRSTAGTTSSDGRRPVGTIKRTFQLLKKTSLVDNGANIDLRRLGDGIRVLAFVEALGLGEAEVNAIGRLHVSRGFASAAVRTENGGGCSYRNDGCSYSGGDGVSDETTGDEGGGDCGEHGCC